MPELHRVASKSVLNKFFSRRVQIFIRNPCVFFSKLTYDLWITGLELVKKRAERKIFLIVHLRFISLF
jgi:hypothetical protein